MYVETFHEKTLFDMLMLLFVILEYVKVFSLILIGKKKL